MATRKYETWMVEILNWTKFNPRAETKEPSWFRCSNNIFFSPTFSDFDAQELCVAWFLMCEVSQRNGGPYRIKISHISKHARATPEKVESALAKLESEGFIRLTTPEETRATLGDCPTPSLEVAQACTGPCEVARDSDEVARGRADPCEVARDSDEVARGRADPCEPLRDSCPTYVRTNETNERNGRGQAELALGMAEDVSLAEDDTPGDSPPGKPKSDRARKAKPVPEGKTTAVFEAYRQAYLERYGVDPPDNRQIRGQIAHLIGKLGAEDSVHVVRYYLRHNKRYYVERQHDFGPCLADAVGLRTQWKTGTQVTSTQAQAVDRRQTTLAAFSGPIARARAAEVGHD